MAEKMLFQRFWLRVKREKIFFWERIIATGKEAKELGDLRNVIFQDNQDRK